MTVAITLLIIGLALVTFRQWEVGSRLALESSVAESPCRFFYVSTLGRRLGVLAGFCLVVLATVGGAGLALYSTAWQALLSDLLRQSELLRFVLLGATVGAVFLLFALPPLRGVVASFRYMLLRHLFFPVLPSKREEQIIQRLMARRGLAFDLEAVADTTSWRSEGGPVAAGVDREVAEFRRYAAELARLHGKLEKTVGNPRNLGCRLLFGKEWELLNSLYRSIRRQMALPSNDYSRNLPLKVYICLFHGYRLMTAYVRLTGFTRRRQCRVFRWFGYRVPLVP